MLVRIAVMGLLGCAFASRGDAQRVVTAPQKVLSGLVVDSATGEPVAFALVSLVGRGERVFAGAGGRFQLRIPGPGTYTVRVTQIGYSPAFLPVRLETDATGAPAGLEMRLTRRPYALPEIAVRGDRCSRPGVDSPAEPDRDAGTIVEAALLNVERLRALEQGYPGRTVFQRVTTYLDSVYTRVGGRVDTVRRDTRRSQPYRRGRVIERRGPWSPRQVANYFTTSDLASEEFRRTHCFWYAGRDSVQDGWLERIDFAPHPDVREPDWAGALLLDGQTGVLAASVSHLVNLPPRGTPFASVSCRVGYRKLAATMVQEEGASCTVIENSRPKRIVVQRWLLVRHEFVGRRPDLR